MDQGRYVNDAHSVGFLANLLGMEAPKGVSVSMGCEVSQLARQIFSKGISATAEGISQPVLVVNNIGDHVVDPSFNRGFSLALKTKSYVEINVKGDTVHGDQKSLDTSYGVGQFYTHACDYLVNFFGERTCFKEYFEKRIQPYFFPVMTGRSDVENFKSIESLSNGNVISTVCAMFLKYEHPEALCERFKWATSIQLKAWRKIVDDYKADNKGAKNLSEYIDLIRNTFDPATKSDLTDSFSEIEKFKDLFIGEQFYPLSYIETVLETELANAQKFAIELVEQKDWIETNAGPLRQRYPLAERGTDRHQRLIQEMRGSGDQFSAIDGAAGFWLVDHSAELDTRITVHQSYALRLRDFISRVRTIRESENIDPHLIDPIMKTWRKLEKNNVVWQFDVAKAKQAVIYLRDRPQ